MKNEYEKESAEERELKNMLLSQKTPPLPDFFEQRLLNKARLLMAEKKQKHTLIAFLKNFWDFLFMESKPILATALLLGFFLGNQLTAIYTDAESEEEGLGEFEIASRLDYFTAAPIQSINDFLLSGEFDELE